MRGAARKQMGKQAASALTEGEIKGRPAIPDRNARKIFSLVLRHYKISMEHHPPHCQQEHELAGGEHRFPQWSPEETRELLSVRAELDRRFTETKRNKPLWEAISSRMILKGFSRTPEQCKSKWKNLLTRYKGSVSMEGEGSSRQFPYSEEMRSIVSGRMERLPSLEKEKSVEEEEKERRSKKNWRKRKRNEEEGRGGGVEEVGRALRELARRQKEREARWLRAAEARAAQRSAAEREWRQAMAAVREERAEMERRWRESEEERWAREEARAERREAIIAAIMARLDDDGH